MAQLLTCPRGHHFDITLDDTEPCLPLACPVCGALCDSSLEPGSAVPTYVAPVSGFPLDQSNANTPSAGPTLRAVGHLPSIPGYDILEKLGQGGMGVVFKARQTSLNRVVALKMILGSAHASPQQLARFQVEAEALASLQHPNIVQVHEVGTHDGSPYFSMEFVEGGSLDARLAGRPQSPREAAGMVELLARAIHAAHQRGIVHRDLKPVNVLLAPDGTPKIADFGLAKRLEEDDDRTLPGTVMGTPNYMAPEQALGKSREVGPPTDVHALGVILYEMLTGKPPFQGPSSYVTLENVKHTEAPAPSRWEPVVPRDLDIICLKCLHKDSRRRYPTAEALADDLRRFLNNEPILARPVGRAERLLKWAQRRPAAAALVFVLLLAILTGVPGGIWYNLRLRAERDRAEKNFQTALDAVNKMLTVVGEERLAAEPGMTQKRRELLEEALKYYQQLLADKQDDPRMRRHVALAHKRVGDIHRLLREQDKANASYLAAIDILKDLVREDPWDPEARQYLADSHNSRGELLRQMNRTVEARMAYEEASSLQKALVQDFADRPEFQQDLARTLYNRGLLFKDLGMLDWAKRDLEEAGLRLTILASKDSGRPAYQQHLGRAYLNLATVYDLMPDPDAAAKARRQASIAVAIFRDLCEKHPKMPDYQQELAIACNNLGNMCARADELAEAEKHHREALTRLQKLAADFPSIPDYWSELANTHNSLASVLARRKDLAAAKKLWDDGEAIQQRLVDQFPKVAGYRGDLGMTRASRGKLALTQKDVVTARRDLEQAIGDLELALRTNSDHPDYLAVARFAYLTLAPALIEQGEDREALDRAEHLVKDFPHQDQGLAIALCFLAKCGQTAAKQPDNDPTRAAFFVQRAEQMIRAATKAGRLRVLAAVRDDSDSAWLRDQPGIAVLLPAKAK